MEKVNNNYSKTPDFQPSPQLEASENQEKKVKLRSAIGSIVGVSAAFAVSVAAFKKNNMPLKDVFQKGDLKQSAKNLYKATQIDYEGKKGFFAMTLQAAGAALGSLIGGLTADKDEKNKKLKLKEALFMTNNVMIPTIFVKTGEFALEHLEKAAKSQNIRHLASNKWIKNLMVALGLVGGMMTSLSVTNTINSKIINPEDENKKKMRPLDFIYHVDDIIPILVCSKSGIFSKLPLDVLLPFIYGYMGSEVGTKNVNDMDEHH